MSNVMEIYDQMCDITAKAKRLEEVSGHSIDELISLFAAGCELQEGRHCQLPSGIRRD